MYRFLCRDAFEPGKAYLESSGWQWGCGLNISQLCETRGENCFMFKKTYRKPEKWHGERQWQTRSPNNALGHLQNRARLRTPRSCQLVQKLLSSLLWLSRIDSGSRHAHRLPTKLLHPASVLLFTLGFLSNFSSVSNNLHLTIFRHLTKTHVPTPRV